MQNQLRNSTTLWGVLLIALGAFFLLQVTGVLGALSSLFWSFAFGAAGAVFLYVFLTSLQDRWWAAIPGFTLLGLAATIFYDRFAPPFFADLGGAVFLGSIGVGFLSIFFTNREQWWAMIPGGALLSVAGVVLISELRIGINPASVLFVGLGLTFALLGLMSTYLNTNLRWAYIPAAIMLLMGILIFTPFVGALGWIWPLALIAGGAYLILRRSELGNDSSSLSLIGPVSKTTDAGITAPQPPLAASPAPATMEENVRAEAPVEPTSMR
jgi:hypothetical protein